MINYLKSDQTSKKMLIIEYLRLIFSHELKFKQMLRTLLVRMLLIKPSFQTVHSDCTVYYINTAKKGRGMQICYNYVRKQ